MIMAIDVGLKRIGVAILLNGIILPLAPIIRINRDQASKEIREILLERGAKTLIIGRPSDEATQRRINDFTRRINFEEMGGNVVFVDEDFSSIEADEILVPLNHHQRYKARKLGLKDSLSATIILQRYTECQKNLK